MSKYQANSQEYSHVVMYFGLLGYVWKGNWTEEKTDEDYKLVHWFKPEQI